MMGAEEMVQLELEVYAYRSIAAVLQRFVSEMVDAALEHDKRAKDAEHNARERGFFRSRGPRGSQGPDWEDIAIEERAMARLLLEQSKEVEAKRVRYLEAALEFEKRIAVGFDEPAGWVKP